MNYPKEIYADTDLVCGEEPKEGHEKYVRADEHDKLVAAVNNLVEIVEGVRNVRWAYDQWRLKDTSEWCALYTAWSKQGVSDRRSNDQAHLPPGGGGGAQKGQSK
jgi:spore coat protein CotH